MYAVNHLEGFGVLLDEPLDVGDTVSSGYSAGSRVTTTAVTYPAGIPVGAVAIMAFSTENSAAITTPAGWTQLSYHLQGAGIRLGIYRRVIDGTETGFNVTTGSGRTSWCIGYATGADAATETGAAVGGSSLAPNPPAVTPSWGSNPTLFLAFATFLGGTNAYTAFPAGYTDFMSSVVSNASAYGKIYVMYKLAAGGAEDPGAYTVNGSANLWSAQTIAIQQA